MADILNQALKDANYNVTGKNKNPAVYYKITAYSFTRTAPTTIQYSITVAAYMNSGGSMGSGTPLDLKLQLSVANTSYIICDKYLKQSASWSGKGDSTATSTVTLTGTATLPIGGTQTVKFLAYRPNQNGDVISGTNLPAGTTIGSGEVVNSSYTMDFPLMPSHVNISNTWVPCTIKVNVVGEGYISVGYSGDYYDLQDFDQTMYEEYGVSVQDNEDMFYVSRDTSKGYTPLSEMSDSIAWYEEVQQHGDANAYSIYMKSNNVKQWVECTVQGL